MKTSVLDILRLAWALYRHPARYEQRIGQLIYNATHGDPFYFENQVLAMLIRRDANASRTLRSVQH
jgi:hypothetical protein